MNNVNSSEFVFLKLIRMACGNEEDFYFPDDVNWSDVMEISVRQGLPALACDGLQTFFDNSSEGSCTLDLEQNEDVKYEWFGYQMACEDECSSYLDTLTSLAEFYSKHGYDMMILKGYSLGCNYPYPRHRHFGDIDCFLFGQATNADKAVSSELHVNVNCSNPHHSRFRYMNCTVENHHTLLDVNNHITNRLMEHEIFGFSKEDAIRTQLNGQDIFFLPPTINAIYLIRHAGEHFATEKISFRHILDWAFFVQKYHDKVDWQYVRTMLKKYGGLMFMDGINEVCVKYLGFSPSVFDSNSSQMADRIISDVFSREQKVPGRSFLSYACFKTARWWQNRWKYRMVYNEGIISSYWHLAKNSLGIR